MLYQIVFYWWCLPLHLQVLFSDSNVVYQCERIPHNKNQQSRTHCKCALVFYNGNCALFTTEYNLYSFNNKEWFAE